MSCDELSQQISSLQRLIDSRLGNHLSGGDPSQNWSKDFLDNYGTRLGQLIRKVVDRKEWEPNLESFLTQYGFLNCYHHTTVVTQNEEQTYQIEHYPMYDFCPDKAIMDMGVVFCQLDCAILKGFNPELAVQMLGHTKIGSCGYWFESKIIKRSSIIGG
jgi:hypothetical protein